MHGIPKTYGKYRLLKLEGIFCGIVCYIWEEVNEPQWKTQKTPTPWFLWRCFVQVWEAQCTGRSWPRKIKNRMCSMGCPLREHFKPVPASLKGDISISHHLSSMLLPQDHSDCLEGIRLISISFCEIISKDWRVLEGSELARILAFGKGISIHLGLCFLISDGCNNHPIEWVSAHSHGVTPQSCLSQSLLGLGRKE